MNGWRKAYDDAAFDQRMDFFLLWTATTATIWGFLGFAWAALFLALGAALRAIGSTGRVRELETHVEEQPNPAGLEQSDDA